jgi:hypothetical protein
MRIEVTARLREVHGREWCVVRPPCRHHHVVDRCRQVGKKLVETVEVGGVESRAATRPELERGPLESLGIARGQDDVGSLGACPPGGLESDAGASTDDDDGLPEQLGFTPRGSQIRGRSHRAAEAIAPRRAFRAPT